MKTSIWTILLAFILCGSAAGQSRPEFVAREYLEAVYSDSIETTAPLFHPDEQARMRAAIVALVDAASSAGDTYVLYLALGVGASTDSLQTLNDLDGTTAFLRLWANTLREESGDSSAGVTIPDSTWTIETIGTLAETPSILHVLCRVTLNAGPDSLRHFSVISVTPHGKRYCMRLTDELERLMGVINIMTEDYRSK
jgi:hypothetical protein